MAARMSRSGRTEPCAAPGPGYGGRRAMTGLEQSPGRDKKGSIIEVPSCGRGQFVLSGPETSRRCAGASCHVNWSYEQVLSDSHSTVGRDRIWWELKPINIKYLALSRKFKIPAARRAGSSPASGARKIPDTNAMWRWPAVAQAGPRAPRRCPPRLRSARRRCRR
jgi:hypothetical protein